MKTEIKCLKLCNHVNIIKIYNCFKSKNNTNLRQNIYYCLVLELVKGGELLNKIIQYTCFSECLSRHVLTQVISGLDYLHNELGIVHRDIKPENILFEPIKKINDPTNYINKGFRVFWGSDQEGYIVESIGGGGIGLVKIGDFGLSKKMEYNSNDVNKLNTPCGTVNYAAPEIVTDKQYSNSVDIWALGCVLYTMICGFPPFYDDNMQKLTQKVACGHFEFVSPWWDHVSIELKHLVVKLLNVDPKKRFNIIEARNHPWLEFKPNNSSNISKNSNNNFSETPTPISPDLPVKEAFDVGYQVQRIKDINLFTKKNQKLQTPLNNIINNTNKQHLCSLVSPDIEKKQFAMGIVDTCKERLSVFNLTLNKPSIIERRNKVENI